MTIEDRLTRMIVDRYGSIAEFSKVIGIPRGTMTSILRRGIGNANVVNIIKIGEGLGISVDGLARGEIIPAKKSESHDINDLMVEISKRILDDETLTLFGNPISDGEREALVSSINAILALANAKNIHDS